MLNQSVPKKNFFNAINKYLLLIVEALAAVKSQEPTYGTSFRRNSYLFTLLAVRNHQLSSEWKHHAWNFSIMISKVCEVCKPSLMRPVDVKLRPVKRHWLNPERSRQPYHRGMSYGGTGCSQLAEDGAISVLSALPSPANDGKLPPQGRE